jgi:hypothetical protein
MLWLLVLQDMRMLVLLGLVLLDMPLGQLVLPIVLQGLGQLMLWRLLLLRLLLLRLQ